MLLLPMPRGLHGVKVVKALQSQVFQSRSVAAQAVGRGLGPLALVAAVVLEASASEGASLEADRLGAIGIGANGSNSALPTPASFS